MGGRADELIENVSAHDAVLDDAQAPDEGPLRVVAQHARACPQLGWGFLPQPCQFLPFPALPASEDSR